MLINRFEIVVIIILGIIVGLLVCRILQKRKDDIIKVAFYRDDLPPAKAGTKWLQGAVCFMKDGTYGKVKGNCCEKIVVL